MGHSAAITHESFVKKLSFNSGRGGTTESVYTINCYWSRTSNLPEIPPTHYAPVFVDMKINLEEREMGYDGKTEYENR
jgi:hypothetical protein